METMTLSRHWVTLTEADNNEGGDNESVTMGDIDIPEVDDDDNGDGERDEGQAVAHVVHHLDVVQVDLMAERSRHSFRFL